MKKKRATTRTKNSSDTSMKIALKESQNMLEMVINNVPQHIFWKDINSTFMGCNVNFAHTVGYDSPSDIVGKTDFDLTDESKANHFIEIDKKVMSENQPIYGMKELHKKSDGEKVWLHVNKVPLCNNDGKVIGVLGTFEDVTDKVTLSSRLEKNAEKYKALVEKTNTAYMIMDIKLRILEANKVFSDLVGAIDVSDIIGRSPRSWVTTNDINKFDEAFDELLQGLPINELELTLLNDQGVSIIVAINANIIENGGKRIFCLLRDISGKKVAEDKKYIERQKKKDRLKQNILEIRDNLRNIRVG